MQSVLNAARNGDLYLLPAQSILLEHPPFVLRCTLRLLLAERLFQLFDKAGTGRINFEEFIAGLALCCRGDTAERARFLFEAHDLAGDGVVSRSELRTLLNHLPQTVIHAMDEASRERERIDKKKAKAIRLTAARARSGSIASTRGRRRRSRMGRRVSSMVSMDSMTSGSIASTSAPGTPVSAATTPTGTGAVGRAPARPSPLHPGTRAGGSALVPGHAADKGTDHEHEHEGAAAAPGAGSPSTSPELHPVGGVAHAPSGKTPLHRRAASAPLSLSEGQGQAPSSQASGTMALPPPHPPGTPAGTGTGPGAHLPRVQQLKQQETAGRGKGKGLGKAKGKSRLAPDGPDPALPRGREPSTDGSSAGEHSPVDSGYSPRSGDTRATDGTPGGGHPSGGLGMPHLYDSDMDSVATDDHDTPLPGRYHSQRMDSGRISEAGSQLARGDEHEDGPGWEGGPDLDHGHVGVMEGGTGPVEGRLDRLGRMQSREASADRLGVQLASGSESASAEEGGPQGGRRRGHSPVSSDGGHGGHGGHGISSDEDHHHHDHHHAGGPADAAGGADHGGRLSAHSSASSSHARGTTPSGLMGSAPLVDRVVERVFRLARPKDKRHMNFSEFSAFLETMPILPQFLSSVFPYDHLRGAEAGSALPGDLGKAQHRRMLQEAQDEEEEKEGGGSSGGAKGGAAGPTSSEHGPRDAD